MILVTGASGHVGRAVVCRLVSLGHDVVAMVADVQAASRRLPSGIALRVADYGDPSALKGLKQLEIFPLLPLRHFGLVARDLGLLDAQVIVDEASPEAVGEAVVVAQGAQRL